MNKLYRYSFISRKKEDYHLNIWCEQYCLQFQCNVEKIIFCLNFWNSECPNLLFSPKGNFIVYAHSITLWKNFTHIVTSATSFIMLKKFLSEMQLYLKTFCKKTFFPTSHFFQLSIADQNACCKCTI